MGMSEGTTQATRWRETLAERGWAIVPDVPARDEAEAVLRQLGDLLEQYSGTTRHEVRARPGFEHLQYTQSQNGISPHTEAPGLPEPPRYVALHCHRQARCGGGQTLLADGYEFVESLDEDLRSEAHTRLIRFDLVPGSDVGGRKAIAAPILTQSPNDTPPVVRYSYSVLRANSLAAPADEDELDMDLDPFNAALCREGVSFMQERGSRALAPDGSVLVFDNWRMIHAREEYSDPGRHLTRYWVG
jgi:alpha-ketoglutarate-dependent taurine dioxygenase